MITHDILAVAETLAVPASLPPEWLAEFTLPATAFWVHRGVRFAVLGLIYLGCGWLVLRDRLRVPDARKIGHFSFLLIPLLMGSIWQVPPTPATIVADMVLILAALSLFIRPLRERVPALGVMFAAFDRPEDRPHTLWWVTSQFICSYLVLFVLAWWFQQEGRLYLLGVPLIIALLGDGLAEPVGIRFGRHRYRVHSLGGSRQHLRSLEGSACLFVSAIIGLIVCKGLLTTPEYVLGLIVLPTIAAISEGCAPHSWDTPIIFAATGGVLALCVQLV